ncbi:MAG TPA: hypothetical protein VFA55_05985 [Candidatus Kapabacteria bacterium]|nr:hypothetical protein [Candidatus Kapabacteria bacterium]
MFPNISTQEIRRRRIISIAIFFLLLAISYELLQMSLAKRTASALTKYPSVSSPSGPDSNKVYVGIYTLSITSLDLGSQTFQYDGYIWIKYKGDTATRSRIEMMNGQNFALDPWDIRDSVYDIHTKSYFHYITYRIKGTASASYTLEHFPFDTQILTLEFESPLFETNKFVFVPDSVSYANYDSGKVGIGHNIVVPDYNVINSQIYVTNYSYPTDFGIPETGFGKSMFSRAVFEVHVQREFGPYLAKFLFPLFLMLAVSFLVFFIPPEKMEISIVICATSLFTAITIGLLQLEVSMHISYLMTTDRFYVLSYIMIVLAFIETVVAGNAAEEDPDWGNQIHIWSRSLFFPLCGLGVLIIALWDYFTP